MVGFAKRKQLEGHLANGEVLIAEQSQLAPGMPGAMCQSLGYIIYRDHYLTRDDVGIVYQLNVVPLKHRSLIGATLVKAAFDRSAYGCKLFCCWCAQDLQANHFWESMGFIPLAFRTGSRPRLKKDGTVGKPGRIHIFWQRRIREGDTETPYWFPSETSGGAVKENRLVLPIPPGTSWQDAKPAILPGMENIGGVNVLPPGAQDESVRAPRLKKPKAPVAVVKPSSIRIGGLRAIPKPLTPEEKAAMKAAKAEKPKPPREKFKNDPKMVAAARELRDRYMEQVNCDPAAMLPPSACGKYDVSRQIEAAANAMKIESIPGVPMLEAA
jgi:hypothetical protein